jgi:vacuolar-type H+-ATPase subunit F/Vma7
MELPVYIGDPVSATGYRLAGLQVRVPAVEEALEVIEAACSEAPLVLLGSDIASRIPSQQLDALLSRTDPAVVVVPDIRGEVPLPDMAHRLRKQLGVLE